MLKVCGACSCHMAHARVVGSLYISEIGLDLPGMSSEAVT